MRVTHAQKTCTKNLNRIEEEEDSA